MLQVLAALEPQQLESVRTLFQEYAERLDFDLCLQGFGKELAGLPGDYAPPTGCLLLAVDGNESAGCVALRKIGDDVSEMKRLYVRPAFRGHGVGRLLAQHIIEEARLLGYRFVRLDTLPSMREARAMYQSLGFQPIAPYRHYPVADVLFMELVLASGDDGVKGTDASGSS